MSLGSRIKERREALGISREDLAKKIGVAYSAIGNYENDYSTPKIELLYKLFDALDCDANYLYQDDMKLDKYESQSTPEEFSSIIKKFRCLDSHGKFIVKQLLTSEYERCIKPKQNLKSYTYLHKTAAAGTGVYLDDIPTDLIEVPAVDGADFIIGVNGDSMEPTFYDGDMVYVQRAYELNYGDIGIFQMNSEFYIKEYGKEGLISHNQKYDVIKGNNGITCIGKVLGKVE